jgi:lipopolysaccharide biosynthesis glycosyltransferase
MKTYRNSRHSILIILDSNLKFQSLALVVNILQTQPKDSRLVVFYVYDDSNDLQEYQDLLNAATIMFSSTKQSLVIDIKFISKDEANDLTRMFRVPERSPITRTAFLRLFFERWLPKDIDIVLYLDIDILINSNLEQIYYKEFSTALCAELNVPNSLSIGSHLSGHDAPYFNSGVLLINVSKWKELNLESKFIEIGSREAYPFLDQDILNIAFRNQWTRLGRRFNYLHLFGSQENDNSYSEFPSIVHFAGVKPWKQVPLTQYVAQYRTNFDQIRSLHPLLRNDGL